MNARMRKRARLALGIVGCYLIAAAACSTTLTGTLNIVTGPDDGFAQSPQPTSLIVQFINANGDATTVAQTPLPAEAGFSLPPEPGDNVETVQITGFDDAGTAVVSGTSIPFALDQLSGITLNMFVQRTGQFSRLPSADGGTAQLEGGLTNTTLLTTLYSRYLLIADGTGKSSASQLYDTLTWQLLPAPPSLPLPPLSLAYIDTYTGMDASTEAGSISTLLTLGAEGGAVWLDLTDSTGSAADAEVTFEASAPNNAIGKPFSFSLVAGGQTVVAPNNPGSGNTYIVGATRLTGKATTGVLRISPSGVPSWATLNTARLGAAAVFVNGGVYVFGGSPATDGGSGPNGVEFVPDDAFMTFIAAVSPGLPPDTTTGAGAVAFLDGTVLLAGGVLANGLQAPVRLYSAAALIGGGMPSRVMQVRCGRACRRRSSRRRSTRSPARPRRAGTPPSSSAPRSRAPRPRTS